MNVYEKYYINLEENRDIIIDAFVAVYGEKHRKLIADRLDKVYINTYITAEELERYVNRTLNHKACELTLTLLEEEGFELDDEQKNYVLEDNTYKLSDDIKAFIKMCYGWDFISIRENFGIISTFDEEQYTKKSDYGRNIMDEERVYILNQMGASVTVDNYKELMESGDIDDVLERLERLISKVKEIHKQYFSFKETLEEELAEIDRCSDIEVMLREKRDVEYLKSICEFIPQEEQEKTLDALQKGRPSYYKSEYFDYCASRETLIESFSSLANEKLEQGSEWEQDSIRDKRISFFKLKGIDLGDDYNAYMDSQLVMDIIPKVELADKIASLRKTSQERYENELIEQTGSYQDNENRIQELGLLDEDSYCPEFVRERCICLSTNVINKNGVTDSKAVIHIPIFGMLTGYEDVNLIHELGHAIELELLECDESGYIEKTGFEYCYEELKNEYVDSQDKEYQKRSERAKREFEILSETIHQALAMEVTQHLHSQGHYLISSPSKAEIRGGTSYEWNYVMVKKFYDTYKQDVIDARMSDLGFKQLLTKVPYESIKKLNELVKVYDVLPRYVICDAINEGRDIPERREHDDLLNRMRELMEHFEEKSGSELLQAAIDATEKSVSLSNIENAVNEILSRARDKEPPVEERGEN